MATIKEISGEIIHDSRGEETIQVTVITDSDKVGSAAVPSGKSKGTFEAKAIEPSLALKNIKDKIEPALIGKDIFEQEELDARMIKLDGTDDKHYLGANAILGVSLAISRAAAAEKDMPLYRYIGHLCDRQGFSVPIPMMNLINGGLHAKNNLDIQEFMVVPDRLAGFRDQLSAGKLIFAALGRLLKDGATSLPFGDEGGYAPNFDSNEAALDALQKAIKEAGYSPWNEVSMALDLAATDLPEKFEISPKRYLSLFSDYPILSMEDPFAEDNWKDWSEFRMTLEKWNTSNKKLLLVGDDLFVTNYKRLEKGIETKAANAILLKLNQVGSLSETLKVADLARSAGMFLVVSHRSGETLDDYIADLAVGIGAQFIKAGAPNEKHPERMKKYERLLKIEQELHV